MGEHHKGVNSLDSKLKLGLLVNTSFTLIEFIAGVLFGSLALTSDAGHNLTDSLSILISFFGNKIAKREANEGHSYGYGRYSILTALLNGVILIGLAGVIFYEAFLHIANPQPVNGGVIMLIALVGILVNGSIAFIFRKDTDDLNIRGSYINMFYDMLASVGALVAGFLIVLTGKTIFDPIISIFIGILLIRSSAYVVRAALHILLEGVPEGISTPQVTSKILSVPEVKHVDDLHIWAISSQYAALSCHVVIDDCDLEKSRKIVQQVKEELRHAFHIEHATIETELTPCFA